MSAINALFLTLLNQFASLLGGSYGLAIIVLTLIIRAVLVPITLPSLKSHQKIKTLKPELDKLKKKYGKDKQLFAQKQMEFYKSHNVNLAAGCLPQLVQIALFIIFYRVLMSSLSNGLPEQFSVNFLWFDLTQPDGSYLLPILAGVTQFLLALMLLPAVDTAAEKALAANTPSKKDDKQAEDLSQMAETMQSQMIYIMPAMTFFFALRFPAGLALYWITSTIFSLIQQYFVSGWGGLAKYFPKT